MSERRRCYVQSNQFGEKGWNLEAQRQADEAYAKLTARRREKAKKRQAKAKNKGKGVFVGTYADYMQSPQWAKKRRKARKFYGGRCTICTRREDLQVHHRHYRTLFRESMADLDLLCGGCHRNVHEDDKGTVDHDGRVLGPGEKFLKMLAGALV